MRNNSIRIIRYDRTAPRGGIFRMTTDGANAGPSPVRDVIGVDELSTVLRSLSLSTQDVADNVRRVLEDGEVRVPVGRLTEQQMEIVRL